MKLRSFNLLVFLPFCLPARQRGDHYPARAQSTVNSNADTVAKDGACTLRKRSPTPIMTIGPDCTAGAGADTISRNYTTLPASQAPCRESTVITITWQWRRHTIHRQP
ncbi:MAG: hypothetical protein IPJ47_17875 [Anaerolineales bacterium]|nr:hypothetical protein [Anaerolineales bacterium]